MQKLHRSFFAKEKVDGFFLEYDDNRSSDFVTLKLIPKDVPKVALGPFTSKHGELEDNAVIKESIDEASQFVSKSQICLSPQCGFASTHDGNIITEKNNGINYVILLNLQKSYCNKKTDPL